MSRPAIDLKGKRFGRLTVIERAPNYGRGARWWCQCDCGTKVIVRGSSLTAGITTSCGCYLRDLTSKRCTKDLTGQRFGKLVVLERASEHRRGQVTWKCRCDCGNLCIVVGADLRTGATKSCGCLKHKDEGEAAFNALWYTYRTSHQRSRRLASDDPRAQFTLTKEQFRDLTQQNCFYCGKPPSTVKHAGYGDYVYNGLDRVDNTKGYTLDNVVSCCAECNFHKGSLTQSEFLSWLDRIAAFRSNRSL